MTTTEKTAKISDNWVATTLNEIVEEFGEDYVYQRVDGMCEYYHDNKPSCIVGHVITRLTPKFKPSDGSVALNVRQFLDAGYSNTATAALQIAQGMQDDGVPWGPCAKAACVALWNHVTWNPDEALDL